MFEYLGLSERQAGEYRHAYLHGDTERMNEILDELTKGYKTCDTIDIRTSAKRKDHYTKQLTLEFRR